MCKYRLYITDTTFRIERKRPRSPARVTLMINHEFHIEICYKMFFTYITAKWTVKELNR